ncbi:MAG TPA: hypothetical protein VM052_07720 [Candidatus Limnocylindrales bacterium]|nr:hypothetical protein [Candidatus Limnocylindrales bacterium]
MTRRLVTAILTALALVALSVPALAKEGAVTKFDSLPTDWHAGQTYTLGYLIKMDGVEPYKADKSEIIATSLDGKTNLIFPGVADTTPGHYTAKVMFPNVATYTWKVTQGSFFAPFDMGAISVLPALGATSSAATPAAPASDPLRDAIPFAAAGAAIFAALVLATTQRRRLIRAS